MVITPHFTCTNTHTSQFTYILHFMYIVCLIYNLYCLYIVNSLLVVCTLSRLNLIVQTKSEEKRSQQVFWRHYFLTEQPNTDITSFLYVWAATSNSLRQYGTKTPTLGANSKAASQSMTSSSETGGLRAWGAVYWMRQNNSYWSGFPKRKAMITITDQQRILTLPRGAKGKPEAV